MRKIIIKIKDRKIVDENGRDLLGLNSFVLEHNATEVTLDFSNMGVDDWEKCVDFETSNGRKLQYRYGNNVKVVFTLPTDVLEAGNLKLNPFAIKANNDEGYDRVSGNIFVIGVGAIVDTFGAGLPNTGGDSFSEIKNRLDDFKESGEPIEEYVDRFALKVEVYTKTEVDTITSAIYGEIIDVKDLAEGNKLILDELTGSTIPGLELTKADKTYVDTKLNLKADKATTYTKTEVDTSLGLKADKTEVNTKLNLKADKATTYTKTEVDTKLGLKADKTTTYTKTEVNTKLNLKADKTTTYTKTEVYNKAEVDSLIDGVEVALTDYYKKTEVDTKLGLKADKTELANKADVSALALKADKSTTYTKTEVDDKFNDLGHTIKRYGVRRKLGATTAELERIGNSIGLVANADTNLGSYNVVVNDFDTIYPWSHMKKCIITDTGKVIYETDPDYEVANGDYMVEVPPFYIKHTNDGENLEYWVSELGGADYEKVDKFYIGRFKTSEGHKSMPYVPPLVLMNRPNFRTGATSKGAGWGLIDMKAHYALRTLYQVEFAHLNSQLKLGQGVSSARYSADDVSLIAENNTNRIVVSQTTANQFEVGETISIGSSLGNPSVVQGRLITNIQAYQSDWEIVFDGEPANILVGSIVFSTGQHSGKTLDLTSSSGTSKGRNGRQSISYRGVEDIFGNIWEWVDGALISDHQTYVFDNPEDYADTLTENATEIGYVNIDTNGYPLEMGYDIHNKYVEFPVTLGGGSSTGYSDYYYQNTGVRAPLVGGYWINGSNAGLFYWSLSIAPSAAFVFIGSRLLFVKP